MTLLRQAQLRLLEMGLAIHSILKTNNIPYVITYGTLLGAVRHHGFIPWDDDLDFYLFDKYYDEAIDLLRKNLPKDMFLEDSYSEPLYFHGWAHVKDLKSYVHCKQYIQDNAYQHHGLSVDLYKATLIPRGELKLFQLQEQKKYYERRHKHGLIADNMFFKLVEDINVKIDQESSIRFNNEDVIYGFMSLDGDYLEVNEVFPLREYSFEEHSFYGPNSYHSFLERCYGNYLELPLLKNVFRTIQPYSSYEKKRHRCKRPLYCLQS